MKQVLEQLLDGDNLSRDEAFDVMLSIMSGEFDDAQIAGFLMALRSKGETVDEITGFAHAMRKKMVKVTLSQPAIDICGTGGDSSGTFNISTAAAFVVAGAGVHVAKHGNRSMTSKSGSADVLQALGIPINLAVEKSAENIDSIGLGFMFAPAYHPAMKYAINARKSLAIRTVFNILGPLCNPADVKAQAMGIFDPNLTEIQANVLKALGSTDVLIFNGRDGLDEISTTTTTKISQIQDGGDVNTYEFDAIELGLDRATLDDLKGGDPKENADIICKILNGEKGSGRDIVLINAAAGIVVDGKAQNLKKGLEKAAESVDSGAALDVLNQLAA
ncbi:MAG TPA: anthranilate phosphoribosyltransferase [Candidatus Marinimicrobia bacterium]|jgi:anthranilate phosphoribosyltransferase|nr:anthranilate phosphoribosyltransferase [Candidatus Neomarinimicrobiota bacterium]HBN45907.1 anthranilate phosphoribosyltransferase [Candidatus Neomarinimicrobiota bacterium]HBR86511.1 anthranilate phosphoribosyltransferase [Candidatus Neomarinimicrobiota bacterium]|tara:strand:+ start:2726 stop:3721 length:996 start_codon:yes stop_codon:yes gene_type:complete